MVYLGAAIFKITRLLVIAVSSVHFFACIFYKVKQISADSPEEVAAFYTSRGIGEKASQGLDVLSVFPFTLGLCALAASDRDVPGQELANQYVSHPSRERVSWIFFGFFSAKERVVLFCSV